MRRRRGCGLAALGALFLVIGCLVFSALAGGLVFTGEVSLYAPRLAGLEPEPNYAFRPTTPITLTFDQPMNSASVEAAFELEPVAPGTFRWNEDLTAVTFIPEGAGYEPGMAYRVRLSSGAEAGTLPLTTERTVEWGFSLPPLLDQFDPPPGAVDLGPRSRLRADFHYPLDCPATLRNFSLTPDAFGLLTCKDQILTFQPGELLQADTTYMASLENVYLEKDPWPRPGLDWEFRTAPPLAVEKVEPRDAGVLGDLWSTFSITFNRPVIASSVVSRFALIGGDGLPVLGQPSWAPDGATIFFQPDKPLRPATQYQLVLQDGVQDELGFELTEGVQHLYVTSPMLGLPIPVPGSKDVALDKKIRVPFTGPMDRASVEAGLVISPALEGEMAWQQDTLLFLPQDGLAPETVYQLSLDADIRDASGAPLAESRQWAFATQTFLLDARLPSVAVLEELQQPIVFSFALPMDRESVEEGLAISPPTSGEMVWSDGDRIVMFQPDPAWLPGADYEITLSGRTRTKDGSRSLGRDRSFSFSTAVAERHFQ